MKLSLKEKDAYLILWCVRALKEQHIKLLLDPEDERRDWVTLRSDKAEAALVRALEGVKTKR